MWEHLKKNPKLLFLGSFVGAIAVIIVVVAVMHARDQNRIANLAKLFTDWQTVAGKISRFEARMPGQPEYASQDLPLADPGQTMRQEMYVGGDTHMSYFVSATQYPSEVTGDEEQNLRASLGGMVNAISGGKIISSSYHVPFSGANYLEFEAYGTGNGNSASYKGRILLDAQSLYEAYVTYPKDSYSDAAYTYFVNSFSPQ